MSRSGQVCSKHGWRAHHKVNKDIQKVKRVNIVFDILHIVGNSLMTLLRTGKILVMAHDPSA